MNNPFILEGKEKWREGMRNWRHKNMSTIDGNDMVERRELKMWEREREES